MQRSGCGGDPDQTPVQVMSGSEDGKIWRWRTHDASLVAAQAGHRGPVTSVKCNPTRQLVASAGEEVCLWLPA